MEQTRQQSDFYKTYIRSDAWAYKVAERKAIDAYTCIMCGRPEDKCRGGLQVHHISYDRLGNEDVYRDLITLCGSCHVKIHKYYKRIRSKQDRRLGNPLNDTAKKKEETR